MTDIAKLTELLYRAMPYPHQIKNLKFEEAAIRFEWRGVPYRLSETFGVDEVGNGVLIGSDRAILIRELINHARAQGEK